MERDSWLYLFLLITIGVVTANALVVLSQPAGGTQKGTQGDVFFGRIQNTLNWAITNIYGKPQS